jgi:polysaccharide biosynthesis/export protein
MTHSLSIRLGLVSAFLAAFASPAACLRGDDDTTAAPHVVYGLSPQDKIRVDVYQEDDLTSEVRVDALGNINLPLLASPLHVAGLTVQASQKAIEDAYHDQRLLVHPQVTITIEEYAPREVSIQGMVKSPGRFLLPPEGTMSVVDLVTKAGGFTDIAKGSDVTITHTGLDGKKTTVKVDVDSIIKGKKSADTDGASLLLQPGDVVYVPERLI